MYMYERFDFEYLSLDVDFFWSAIDLQLPVLTFWNYDSPVYQPIIFGDWETVLKLKMEYYHLIK